MRMEERKHKRDVGDDCDGNGWAGNGRRMSWLGGSAGQMAGGERVSQPWTAAGVPRTFNLLTHQTSCVVAWYLIIFKKKCLSLQNNVETAEGGKMLEDTYFFCSFLFFSAGPPRVPIPKPSLGELSASGVPARNVYKHLVQQSDRTGNTATLAACMTFT